MPSRRNYGAIERSGASGEDEGYTSADEAAGRLTQRLHVDLDTRGADYILVLLFFVSGLVDGAVYNSWGSFVSMQTGTKPMLAIRGPLGE